ncbi:MAG: hypothetical protein ACLUHE_14505 [Christensenellales bacterium]
MAVAAHALLTDGRAGEIRVGEHKLVAMPHLGNDFEQFRADNRGNTFEHKKAFLSFVEAACFVRRPIGYIHYSTMKRGFNIESRPVPEGSDGPFPK